MSLLDKINAKIVTYWDDEYPELLRNIYFPPLLIYVIGEMKNDSELHLAIVGTRNPTEYGKLQAEKLSTGLSKMELLSLVEWQEVLIQLHIQLH